MKLYVDYIDFFKAFFTVKCFWKNKKSLSTFILILYSTETNHFIHTYYIWINIIYIFKEEKSNEHT